ncbi:hypothetical protein [Anaerofustis stercorihominis]|uniref:Uncharacterized protein n=1 Tax=Anaerofustis stercorihominis TaxID=214853 RepID=A0A3E3DUF3_9FIRM|nr:hypothetical protein [Anaerofustis stercorihominis]RGD72914.1 hypothetical protein DW687_11770 [Anaerofustis stercorihominis]
MKYKNIKTGAIIDIASVLSGDDWECLTQPKTSQKKPKKINIVERKESETETPEVKEPVIEEKVEKEK